MTKEKFFEDILGISEGELSHILAEASVIKTVKKGDILVREGELQKNIYLLMQGIYREFYETEDGEEITDFFGFRPGDIACGNGQFDMPSPVNIEAVSDGKFICISLDAINDIVMRYPEAAAAYQRLVMSVIKERYLIENALRKDATEKYYWFTENYPGLIDKVHHRQIASFLNVTPVTLSRIRAKFRETC